MNKLSWAAVVACVVLSGCTTPMPLGHDTDTVKPNEPIVLMTVTLRNDFKAGFTPKLMSVTTVPRGTDKGAAFVPDEKARHEDRNLPDNTYYVRMKLAPGVHRLNGIVSQAMFFQSPGPTGCTWAMSLSCPAVAWCTWAM